MKTELTSGDLIMLQDALAYKLLYLKKKELITGVDKGYTLEIMRLAAKLEALRREYYEDCLRTKRD